MSRLYQSNLNTPVLLRRPGFPAMVGESHFFCCRSACAISDTDLFPSPPPNCELSAVRNVFEMMLVMYWMLVWGTFSAGASCAFPDNIWV